MADGRPFLSVYGHVTIDQIISVNRFPEINETVDVLSKSTTLGGTGTNIAMAAAKLGVPTAICAFVGEDFPVRYEDEMRGSGLIMDEMLRIGGCESSQAIVVNDAEMRQRVIFNQGPQGSASNLNIMLTKNASSSPYVHFCTGEPDYYISAMKAIRGFDPKIALDPAQEVYKMWDKGSIQKALSFSDALFCNNYEARVIERYLGIENVLEIEKDLVVCTEGERGSTAKIDGERMQIPAIKGKAIKDATGAGDAYRAGFYCGLYNGYSVHGSLILASATASFVVEKVGALTNIPRWEEVLERADRYLIRC
ncbi:MAG: PfkB family carbohydrate kinase [Candidatus Methanoplasma sp.]|jgi:sugar/nucleoside kinase (ribokinase family)|nr:PfkB family carbohydrate kinase [Candidatus Methanoplasma sp.]